MLPTARMIAAETLRQRLESGRRLEPSTPVVAYCVHGDEISQNAVAARSAVGIEAYALAGGIEGWREAGGRIVPKAAP